MAPTVAPAPVALYVHFPFCLSICPYCDFVVYGGRAARGPDNRVADLVDALITEIGLRGRAARLGSVYMGGGTPSLMSVEQVGRVLAATDAAFGIAQGAEITLEVNPGPADRGDLRGFRSAGVNRVSIGVQSLNTDELRTLGRRHTPADVTATIRDARDAGIASVSVDLLYDVPGQTLASWRATLADTLALEPDHVSAYALTLDEHEPSDDHLVPTPGATQWRARARREQDDDTAAAMYEFADEQLARSGQPWYEISNWSRPGHESRHNNVYWRGGAWEAVGPGAHAYDGVNTRRWNAANLNNYVAALAADRLPPGGQETTTAEQSDAERAILRLRTVAGLPREWSERPEYRSAIAWALDNGLLEEFVNADNEEGVRLTRRGRLLSNELFSRLLAPAVVAA